LPGETKTIICLANSRKMSGRCVAGREILPGGFGDWIRPVSSRSDKELSAVDRHYESTPRPEPALLDVIEIDFLRHDPHPYQPENYLIDDGIYWRLSRKANFAEAVRALDPKQSHLWGLSRDTSYHGQRDRVPLADAPSFNSSLRLVRVSDLRIRVLAESAGFGNMKKKLRGYFTYSHFQYGIMITDPIIENDYLRRPQDTYQVGDALLCVSLGEPFDGYAYKLIAGVILPP
jgi:hypothetical protein